MKLHTINGVVKIFCRGRVANKKPTWSDQKLLDRLNTFSSLNVEFIIKIIQKMWETIYTCSFCLFPFHNFWEHHLHRQSKTTSFSPLQSLVTLLFFSPSSPIHLFLCSYWITLWIVALILQLVHCFCGFDF